MATVAIPLSSPPGPSAVAVAVATAGGAPIAAERTIAEAIAGHRAARQQILARADASKRATDASTLSRRLDDALRALRKLEAEFAEYRTTASKHLEDAKAENSRLSNLLHRARLSTTASPKPFEKEISVSKLESIARSAEPVWRRSRSRSTQSVTPADLDAETSSSSRRRTSRASTGGLFNRSSFNFPRSTRSSRNSDRSSGKWGRCF